MMGFQFGCPLRVQVAFVLALLISGSVALDLTDSKDFEKLAKQLELGKRQSFKGTGKRVVQKTQMQQTYLQLENEFCNDVNFSMFCGMIKAAERETASASNKNVGSRSSIASAQVSAAQSSSGGRKFVDFQLDLDEAFTLFAPSNRAFSGTQLSTILPRGLTIAEFLNNHIIPDRAYTFDQLGALCFIPIPTKMEGEWTQTVCKNGVPVRQDGQGNNFQDRPKFLNEKYRDIVAGNGIIHAIDNFLKPSEFGATKAPVAPTFAPTITPQPTFAPTITFQPTTTFGPTITAQPTFAPTFAPTITFQPTTTFGPTITYTPTAPTGAPTIIVPAMEYQYRSWAMGVDPPVDPTTETPPPKPARREGGKLDRQRAERQKRRKEETDRPVPTDAPTPKKLTKRERQRAKRKEERDALKDALTSSQESDSLVPTDAPTPKKLTKRERQRAKRKEERTALKDALTSSQESDSLVPTDAPTSREDNTPAPTVAPTPKKLTKRERQRAKRKEERIALKNALSDTPAPTEAPTPKKLTKRERQRAKRREDRLNEAATSVARKRTSAPSTTPPLATTKRQMERMRRPVTSAPTTKSPTLYHKMAMRRKRRQGRMRKRRGHGTA